MRLSFPKTNQSAGLIGSGKLFVALFFVGFLLLFFKPLPAEAKNCGGATVCACGDTVTSNYTLAADLSCDVGASGTYALYVSNNNITLDGANHQITNPGITNSISGAEAAVIVTGTNVTVKNFKITNFFPAVRFSGSATGTIQNNVINSSGGGVDIAGAGAMIITGNTFKSIDMQAVSAQSNGAISSTISNNTFFYNTGPLVFQNGGNNTYYDNESSGMVAMDPSVIRIYSLNNTVNFNFALKYLDNTNNGNKSLTDCPNCTYTVSVSPTETVSSSKTTNVVTGSFVAHRTGIYTVSVASTNPANGDVAHARFSSLSVRI